MKPEEIQNIRDLIEFIANYVDPFEIDPASGEIIINALEKQIPKKPIDDEKKMRWTCPNCAEVVAEYYKGVPKHYCPNCGQRLKWEEQK